MVANTKRTHGAKRKTSARFEHLAPSRRSASSNVRSEPPPGSRPLQEEVAKRGPNGAEALSRFTAVHAVDTGTVSHAEVPEAGRVRVDRWLWAARFFKTRSLATVAVDGGKVHVNGSRVRAARTLKPGDQLKIRRGLEEFEVLVLALADRRGPAATAQALYTETEASVTRRLALAEERRALATPAPRSPGQKVAARHHPVHAGRSKLIATRSPG
jgi:ribosome-associated heat shock protein Hsp15